MNDKEQLLNLVGQVQDCGCDVTDVVKMNYVENDVLVDYLIANGVTIQRWIPVTERLPEEEDADEHDCVLVHTSNRDNLIVAREAVWKCTEFITHWQPLHEPPKGE